MAQADYNVANQSGASFRADLNNQLAAIVSNNSGASEPSTTFAYQWWADTTTGKLKLRNAANSAWIEIVQLDGEWTNIALENGTAAAPPLYFKDSGTDTGLFSGGTDQVNVTTGGTERVEFGTTEVVFNDGGNNYDFRVEGDTATHLLFGDASADKIGIKNSTPAQELDVTGSIAASSVILTGDGSASAPGFAFGSDTNVGFLRPGTDILAATTAGTERARFNATGYLKASNTGAYNSSTGNYHEIRTDTASEYTARIDHFGASAPLGIFVKYSSVAPNGTGNYFIHCQDSGASRMWVQSNGNVENTNNSYSAFSDLKLKENIANAGSQWDDIKDLRVVNFNFKESTGFETHRQIGLIAQEVEEVSPGLVNDSIETDLDGMPNGEIIKTVNYSVLYMKSVKALQEAMARIETLEAKVAALEGA